jgi:hypothetical protein
MLDMLWRAVFRWRSWPRRVTGDSAYGTVENIAAIEKMGISAYVALNGAGQGRPFFGKDEFAYDPELWLLENHTRATFLTKSGCSSPPIWRSFERTRPNETTTSCARCSQRIEVGGSHRFTVAIHAPRPTALGSRLPANAAVASGWGVRGDGPRLAPTFAPFGGQGVRSDGGDTRLSHFGVHPAERLPGRLRRSQTKEGYTKVHAAVETLGHLLAMRM